MQGSRVYFVGPCCRIVTLIDGTRDSEGGSKDSYRLLMCLTGVIYVSIAL